MGQKVNLGLIGTGRIGKLHAEHLAYRIPGAHLLAVSDIFVDAAKECAARLGIPTAVEDHHILLENDDIEAIVICSSTDTHAQLLRKADRLEPRAYRPRAAGRG